MREADNATPARRPVSVPLLANDRTRDRSPFALLDRLGGPCLREHRSWMGNAARSGLALGLAVLLTRLLKVEHAFWVVVGVLPVLSASGGLAARTFWQEQAGTLIGFSVSAVVVAILGPHQAWF